MPMVAPHASLVRYDNAILVSTTKDLASGAKSKQAAKASGTKQSMTATEDILNSILPPREWTEDGQLWVQYVSSTPATRSDVITLQERLDQLLQQKQARETGICPIREELYGQCFDELIRQVTINCSERGLLLLRVRDEIRTAIQAYQTLYESSIAFGMRKALNAEQKKMELEKRIKSSESEKRELEKQLADHRHKCDAFEKKEAEQRTREAAQHAEELDKLKTRNEALRGQLSQLLSIPAQTTGTVAATPGKDGKEKKGEKTSSSAPDSKKSAAAPGEKKADIKKSDTSSVVAAAASSSSSSAAAPH